MTTFVAPSLDFDWPEFQQPFKEAEEPHVKARFDDFNLHIETYTTVGKDNHEIKVLILVPKILDNGPYPVHVKWHGGGFVSSCILPIESIH
jgi:acetyl esterase/lipase